MNKVILILLAFCFTQQLKAQSIKERDVPPAVISSFSSLAPDASKVKWEMEDGMYEGSYFTDKKETSLVFSRDGILTLTEHEIEITDLPVGIVEYLTKQHPSSAITEATKVTDIYGVVNYEVDVASIEYLFNQTGQMISQEKDEEVDDDKE